ncbi:hypothetical protein B0H14DRAFT_3034208 [Mycena olivaceomarginata]|nr:hypothetical protein B0H14DRAFT_3034208 [Mycena olivaceomarginata]
MYGGALNFPAHDLIDDRPPKRPRNGELAPTPEKDNLKGTKRLSCRECRRLKLKVWSVSLLLSSLTRFQCDRVFPCQSCCKRGCAEICPEGALQSGRGSRFILANTEQLHEKITQLSERVRLLEDGLESVSAEHPLLAPDLRRIKTSQELYVPPNAALTSDASSEPVVSPDILQLSITFPFPWTMDLKIRQRIRDALPPRAEAQALVYTMPIQELSPRRLALLLMVLSIGSLVDLSRPLGSLHGEAYHHHCARRQPDFDELHALFFMIWYHLVFSDNRKAVGYLRLESHGFVAKLAQGVNRDGSRLKVIPEEYERRLYQELLNLDCRMSLSLGRPPSLSLSHVDTKPPAYTENTHVPKDEILYHEWKNAFFIKRLATVTPPEYQYLLELDARVRDFHPPAALADSNCNCAFPSILQLHRRCFTEALSGAFVDLHHPYAPSVLATYIGASTLFDREPQLSARFLHFWFNAFSATATSLAPYALQDLDRVCRLFRRVAKLLPFSAKSLPIMEKLAEKARRACSQWHSTAPPPRPPRRRHAAPAGIPPCPPDPRTVCGGDDLCAAAGADAGVPATQGHNRRRTPRRGCPMCTVLPATGWGSTSDTASAGSSHGDEGFASAQPTPFMPGEPRIAANDNFNFEHGALTAELAETSYMAWF